MQTALPDLDGSHPVQDLRAAAPVTEAQAVALAAEHYGLNATAQRLSSERDQNFRLRADGGDYVLKITNPAEHRAITRLQTDALLHLAEREPSVPIPRVLPALNGERELAITFADSSCRIVRVLSFLVGTPIAAIAVSTALRSDLGRCAGRLARGLRDLSAGAVKQKLLWDIQHAAELRSLVDAVPVELRGLIDRFLQSFETATLPALRDLPRQLVHNDLNPNNVVVDPADPGRVTGIIDFGDMTFTARVNDLAIAAAYQVGDGEDPLAPACEVIAAYHSVTPLDAAELDLLFDLMATRMVMSIVIGNWLALRHPENREYTLRNFGAASARLRRIATFSREQARAQIRRACAME